MDELLEGLFLTGVGMGTVFVFLGLLIAVTEGIRVLCGGAASPAPAAPGPSDDPDDAARGAAIVAAVTHHRSRRQRRG